MTPANRCPPDKQPLPNCPPPEAVTDSRIEALYESRTWIKPNQLTFDPIEVGKQAEINVKSATAKFVGVRYQDAIDSLAAKIWIIENAEHTIDLVYYIYRNDLSGRAIMGALCDAVERGVDIRFVVDSIGSLTLAKSDMRALESCQLNAGFMRSAAGDLTVHKARIQTVIFNSITRIGTSPNRRSHDKLLVVDGNFPSKGIAMIGGRNIAMDYFGFKEDGSRNPKTYFDAELLVANAENLGSSDKTVTKSAETYFTLLFYFKGNKPVTIAAGGDIAARYAGQRRDFRANLAKLKGFSAFNRRYSSMQAYMNTGFRAIDVRFAHEFGNLINKRVVRNAMENMERNPNSIARLLVADDEIQETTVRLVSPYYFLARYKNRDGEVVLDEAQRILSWLEEDPERRLEILTNSIITSDNFGAQSVVDMDTAPRLLMSEEMQQRWLKDPAGTEFNADFLSSKEWTDMVQNPQIAVYETGRSDSRLLAGDVDYGKMHAKFIITDRYGFVGTSNFDYRSRLYNNEAGYFFSGDELLADMNADFDYLKQQSYLWGSPEWLEMRQKLVKKGGSKGKAVKAQRRHYKILRFTGLKWLF
ncbi:MAG: phospholipase D-like domain-containing protein [bacterium]